MEQDEPRQPGKRRLPFLSRVPMGSRKKSKTNIKDSPAPTPSASESTTAESSTATIHPKPQPEESAKSSVSSLQSDDAQQNRRSWYGGSWKSKAAPIAQISLGDAGTPASTAPAKPSRPPASPSSARYLSGSMRRSSKGVPVAASLSNITATTAPSSSSTRSLPLDTRTPSKASTDNEDVKKVEDPPLPPDPTDVIKQAEEEAANAGQKPLAATAGWRGWWSKPDTPVQRSGSLTTTQEDAKTTPLPGPTPSEEPSEQAKGLSAEAPASDASTAVEDNVEGSKNGQPKDGDGTSIQVGSWFGLWSYVQNRRDGAPAEAPAKATENITNPAIDTIKTGASSSAPPSINLPLEDSSTAEVSSTKKDAPKSSGWAFWSRVEPKSDAASDTASTHKQVGEIAVSDTPSQNHPEAAQFNERDGPSPKEPPKPKTKGKRGRTQAKDTIETPNKTTPKPSPTRAIAERPGKATETAQIVPAAQAQPAAKPERRNLLLPEFDTTYKLSQQPTYWQQIRRYFIGSEPLSPHLSITPTPPRIKKALAIGVHGYFPPGFFQKVMGPPTGTSIRFANAAAAAIKEWTGKRGYEAEIEKVALEGEGFVADRVETLWKLLLNWIDHIKSADFILVASHSQGVPVSIILVSKLIQMGCISPTAKIGVCAMAGVNLGPFTEFKNRFIGGSALELFDFGVPESKVSKMYQDALSLTLSRGVKIVYIGSIDDQLVSLESSTFSNISHPNIYRAVFIDTRTHASSFLTHLLGFVLKLRNLGIPDHGLIRELSPALAGSLYTGEGHSQIYHDAAVYDLAVRHALETTDLLAKEGKDRTGKVELQVYKREIDAEKNPYFLPWAMRGLLEEEVVRKELGDECQVLLKEFEEWKPTTKGLKDIRFRLEAVRSKL